MSSDNTQSYLVSGAGGFLGARLCETLVNAGNKVTGLDLIDKSSVWRLHSIMDNPLFTYQWKSCVDVHASDLASIDVVVHLAAQADVPLALASPLFTWRVNTENTMALLEAVRISDQLLPELQRKQPVKYIHMSSESSYGDSTNIPIPETEPLNPTNVYGASKAAGDILAQAYARSYKCRTFVIRSGTMYGPRSRLMQVIPIFLRQVLKGKKITVEGGKQTRDFNYVDNVVDAIKLLGEKHDLPAGSIYNIGSGEERTIRKVAEECAYAAKKVFASRGASDGEMPPEFNAEEYIELRPPRAGEERGVRLALDISRAKQELGYSPAVSFQDGLMITAEYINSTLE